MLFIPNEIATLQYFYIQVGLKNNPSILTAEKSDPNENYSIQLLVETNVYVNLHFCALFMVNSWLLSFRAISQDIDQHCRCANTSANLPIAVKLEKVKTEGRTYFVLN